MERERITISIKKKLLDEIDKTIDGVSIRNRSHAIESLSKKALGQNYSKKAVILLGGPDALKYIQQVREILETLDKASYEKAYIAVGYLKDKIIEAIGSLEHLKIEVEYSDKGEGSAGALKPLSAEIDSTFAVFNIKQSSNFPLDKVYSFHKSHSLPATALLEGSERLKGLYIFEPEIFDRIPAGFSMLEDDIFPVLFKENKLATYSDLF